MPIGLDEDYIQALKSNWKFVEEQDIRNIIKERKAFSHKGTYGHALIIAGSQETMGAALLCADACLHSGIGLITACIPESGLTALNTRSPEIMARARGENFKTEELNNYSSIALGPGIGTQEETVLILKAVLANYHAPMVFDADALTLLSTLPDLLEKLPALSILTPHMKEFDRMFGDHKSWWDRIETARQKATVLNVIIVLKNQYSFIVMPDGAVFVNPTGNPAMAVGGTGDVLTGMITGFMAQGYSPSDAAVVGCYLHGKAGDDLKNAGMNSIPPRYLIEKLPFVINDVLV
ncbi:NAD(P)H-hydrate dehydratase [Daejeonella lutea]|uniref:NAD(P)H-hydrate dehydratase n=1 Tax=Daejeonella lutea TaxID=572036 RepID=UPI001116AE05|nr:NAD(P)H-hydrate dehydratase [Daejeonella lutea]